MNLKHIFLTHWKFTTMFTFTGLIIFIIFYKAFCKQDTFSQENKCPSSTCSIRNEENKLNFIILGDWGGEAPNPTSKIQLNVASGMNKISVLKNANFYVSTGDHFYPSGINNADDIRFTTTYENVYNESGHQKLWHMSAGNHDYYKNITGQTAYSRKSWRWNFPDLFYEVKYTVNNRPFADFVFLDTNTLCGSTKDTSDEKPPGPTNVNLANFYWKWLDGQLNKSMYSYSDSTETWHFVTSFRAQNPTIAKVPAPYLFIVGHYPARSKGRHGPTTECLVDKIETQMMKYNVTAYLCGHDHNLQVLIVDLLKPGTFTVSKHYQYTSQNGHIFHHVLSGLGAMYNVQKSSDTKNGGESKFFYPDTDQKQTNAALKELEKGGFVFASLNSAMGKFEYYNGDVVELYSFNIFPRHVII